jgi:putative Holliday junction resolvase
LGEVNLDEVRCLGLDFGDKTVGVAVSHGNVATGAETIRRKEPAALKPTIARLGELIKQYKITHIILGNPLHMDGKPSARSEKTLQFAQKLQRNFKRVTIVLWDERLSTQGVLRVLGERSHVDEMAAVWILESWLDSQRLSSNK